MIKVLVTKGFSLLAEIKLYGSHIDGSLAHWIIYVYIKCIAASQHVDRLVNLIDPITHISFKVRYRYEYIILNSTPSNTETTQLDIFTD